MNSLFWLRTDLRTRDNPALRAALSHGPTIALYYIAPQQWKAHDDAPGKVDFWVRNLRLLRETLEHMNIPLKIINKHDWSTVADDIIKFCKAYKIDAVHANAEWGINERRRDDNLASALEQSGIDWKIHHGASLLIPGSVLTGQGQCYKVFTPYARTCRERLRTAAPSPKGRPKPQHIRPVDQAGHVIKGDQLPEKIESYQESSPELREVWPAGEDAASARLSAFANERIVDYEAARDHPAVKGTSQLSAYLAAGVLSPVQCLHVALSVNQGELDSGKAGVRTWITELLWREFYIHLLVAHPDLSRHQPLQPHTEAVQWRDSDEDFNAWKDGRTGIPIVDAAMRQLRTFGWMHNRLRMITAMFLSKNLLLDWRLGEAWFMQNLVDGDLASNNGGWQWSASTGADSAPYFRVFNPVTQSERFDADGAFIRRWLPELAVLNNKQIHMPSPSLRKQLNYPDAIVDLATSRRRAIDAFSGLNRTRG